jgi:indolepyruvate ferredoxin oxidoreductase alpha subunit
MADFKKITGVPTNSSLVLDGNSAFALGCVHAGYHAATGYPGTPSTEVIDKSLAFVQDKIKVGWSVNEAVAVSVGLGHAMAGYDTLVTMKIPGVFQAGDAISTSAFFSVPSGALVIYAVTDYVPSSTQHVIDARYFFASSRLPVLEPRNHQEMYDIAWTAADLSKKFNTPVIILASGILAHSEGLIVTKESRTVLPVELRENLKDWFLLPGRARINYNQATQIRIPGIKEWCETSDLVRACYGNEDWAIIVNGECEITVKEAMKIAGHDPSILSIAISYPLPDKKIKEFASKIKGRLFIIEDGDKFIEEKIRLLNIGLTGKGEYSTITNWTPEEVLLFLSSNGVINYKKEEKAQLTAINRPPAICAGCQYRALALTINKLKKKKKIYASFGDIGCSTLLFFQNAIDTVSCMGASDSMRQGFVISRPEMASKVISVIGDSTECHSGLDATRNSVFRNVPGVKIILDNNITAMTGGQVAPSSKVNLEGRPHRFSLKKAIEAEGGRTVVVDSYNLKEVEEELIRSLQLAEQGTYSTLIFEAPCIRETAKKSKIRKVEIDYEKCKKCGLCDICPGLELDENKIPHFTSLCTNCGSNKAVCMQCCPFDAIKFISETFEKEDLTTVPVSPAFSKITKTVIKNLPRSLRLAIRGIGGQGNLFFGKVLTEVALLTQYAGTNIVKGDTHGMAQMGGPVLSTFSCGDVYSSVLAPNSADVLIVMEISEILRPGFLGLLKKGGSIIINTFTSLPVNVKKEDYPKLEEIEKTLQDYNVIKIDANKLSCELGDLFGKSANLVVFGVLSMVKPFNLIPEEIWVSAILSVSPDDISKSYNILAFDKGRNELIEK